jgi:hypothetical protein
LQPFAIVSEVLRWISAPISRWSPRMRLAAAMAAITCCIARAAFVVAHSESVFVVGDARFYMGIANNDYSQVMQPFASRQLGALVVAAMAHLFHWTIQRGFLLEGSFSLVFMLATLYFLIMRTQAPRWILFAIALVPFWASLLEYLVLPDLWYSALLMVMLLLLSEEHMMGAALMMFPLMLSRESTSLTLVCFLVAAWRWLRWRDRVVAVASTIAAGLIVSHLAVRAQSNLEHLPQAIYMLVKVPWNFVHNILGIALWSNVYPDLCKVPVWSMPFHMGPVQALGVCGFSSFVWIQIGQALMTNFGLLPLLAAFVWWRHRRVTTRNPLLRFTLLYGFVSLLLAPMLGTWIVHLIGYGWPLFFVALPLMFDGLIETSPTGSRAAAAAGCLSVHLILFYASDRWLWLPQFGVDALLWLIGYFLLRHWFSRGYQPAERSPIISAGNQGA